MRRMLAAFFLALALLVAPAAPTMAAASASDHQAMMAMPDHCADRDESKAAGEGMECCVATCAVGLAIVGETAFALRLHSDHAQRSAVDRHGRSVLAELPTPPPRAG